MHYAVYPSIGGTPTEVNAPAAELPKLVTIMTDAGDGTEDVNIEIPRLAQHTIIVVNFTGTTDTLVFLHISNDAQAGDVFEIVSLNAPKITVTNSTIFGISMTESKRAVLHLRKIADGDYGDYWIGSQSVPPSWDHT